MYSSLTVMFALLGAGVAGYVVVVPWEVPKSMMLMIFSAVCLLAAMLSADNSRGCCDSENMHEDDDDGRTE